MACHSNMSDLGSSSLGGDSFSFMMSVRNCGTICERTASYRRHFSWSLSLFAGGRAVKRCAFAVALFAVVAYLLQPMAPDPLASNLEAGDVPATVGDLGFRAGEDEETLRRRLIELTAKRAAGLSADELRLAIAAAEHGDGRLPAAAQEILETLQAEAAEIRAEANRKIAIRKQATVADLQELMVKFTRDGRLDEAVAVRDLMRALRMPSVVATADPGNMYSFRNRVGKSFHFRVTGSRSGSVYGTDIYTADSTLAAAAVHAGVLRNGQTGLVKVTMMPGQQSYTGLIRNGINSSSYSAYSSSYRVERVKPADVDSPEEKSAVPESDSPAEG